MLINGTRAFSHCAPTTYKRITPDRGCGFILKTLGEHETKNPHAAHLTKEDVYLGTPWYHRPGFASVLWTSLLEDGLIASDDGMEEYSGSLSPFSRKSRRYSRAYGHYEFGRGWTVRYHLTPKGRGILYDMMARVNKNKTPVLNTVGSVAEYDAKKDNERDILEKEALDCAKLAADYVGENQKLRAEKDDMKERLKKLHERLDDLESTVYNIRLELRSIIDESEA